MKIKQFVLMLGAAAALMLILAAILTIIPAGQAYAQGFNLSQLFGGGNSGSSRSSGGSAVAVDRGSAPYVGEFKGNQGPGADLKAHFACYPAHDSALPNNPAFLCYTTTPAAGGPPTE